MNWFNKQLTKQREVEKSPFLSRASGTNEMLCIEPKSFDDVQIVIDHLKTNQHAILSIAAVKKETAQRILDFVSGAVYALDGNIHPLKDGLFALTPKGSSINRV